jgi:hypothetical protein
MTITEFLLARIAEDERVLPCANCGRSVEPDGDDYGHVSAALPDGDPIAEGFWADPCPDPLPERRPLAECEAKRRIVELETRFAPPEELSGVGALAGPSTVLRALASVYADHDDFDPAWGNP